MLAFDSSALVKRYREEVHSEWMADEMERDTHWCGSALLAPETAIALARALESSDDLVSADARLSRDLEFFDLIPVDGECLSNSIQIGRGFGLRTLDAIHLAALRELPPPFGYITFDARQAEAAAALGIDLLVPA